MAGVSDVVWLYGGSLPAANSMCMCITHTRYWCPGRSQHDQGAALAAKGCVCVCQQQAGSQRASRHINSARVRQC